MLKSLDIRKLADVYWREEDGQAVVAAWRASGERLSAFARRHHVHPQRIARWRRRLEAAPTVHFHPVHVTGAVDDSPSAGAIEITLPSGVHIRVPPRFDAEDLRRVVSVLEADASC